MSRYPRASRGRNLHLLNAVPFFFKSLTIFCPVSNLMLGTAYLSLMRTPIWEGDIPFLAMVTMRSTIVLGVWETHLGDLLLKGVTVELIPFPFPLHCMRPISMVFVNSNIILIFDPTHYYAPKKCQKVEKLYFYKSLSSYIARLLRLLFGLY